MPSECFVVIGGRGRGVIAATAIAILLTAVLPKRYTSTTVVLVEHATVEFLVRPVGERATNNR